MAREWFSSKEITERSIGYIDSVFAGNPKPEIFRGRPFRLASFIVNFSFGGNTAPVWASSQNERRWSFPFWNEVANKTSTVKFGWSDNPAYAEPFIFYYSTFESPGKFEVKIRLRTGANPNTYPLAARDFKAYFSEHADSIIVRRERRKIDGCYIVHQFEHKVEVPTPFLYDHTLIEHTYQTETQVIFIPGRKIARVEEESLYTYDTELTVLPAKTEYGKRIRFFDEDDNEILDGFDEIEEGGGDVLGELGYDFGFDINAPSHSGISLRKSPETISVSGANFIEPTYESIVEWSNEPDRILKKYNTGKIDNYVEGVTTWTRKSAHRFYKFSETDLNNINAEYLVGEPETTVIDSLTEEGYKIEAKLLQEEEWEWVIPGELKQSKWGIRQTRPAQILGSVIGEEERRLFEEEYDVKERILTLYQGFLPDGSYVKDTYEHIPGFWVYELTATPHEEEEEEVTVDTEQIMDCLTGIKTDLLRMDTRLLNIEEELFFCEMPPMQWESPNIGFGDKDIGTVNSYPASPRGLRQTFAALAEAIQGLGNTVLHNKTCIAEVGWALGVREFAEGYKEADPMEVSESLRTRNGKGSDTIKIYNLIQLMQWQIIAFEELIGAFDIDINIKDADPTKEGEQEVEIRVANIAEALTELLGNSINTVVNSELSSNLALKAMVEAGQAKKATIVVESLVQSIIDYLAFEVKDEKFDVPLQFTPGGESLEEILEPVLCETRITTCSAKTNFQEQVNELLQAAAVTRLRNYIGFGKSIGGSEIGKSLGNYIKGIAKSKINSVTGGGKFEDFLEAVEDGYKGTSYTNSIWEEGQEPEIKILPNKKSSQT